MYFSDSFKWISTFASGSRGSLRIFDKASRINSSSETPFS